ncbi:MAG: methyltransferase [Pseudomonadota bacterium]
MIARSFLLLSILLGLASNQLVASEITEEDFETVLKAERRSDEEKARDANRLPEQTLKFFGLNKAQTVLEIIPGRGWYTQILGPLLEEKGKLYLGLGSTYAEKNIVGQPGFKTTSVLKIDVESGRAPDSRFYTLSDFDFGVKDVDLVLTFRNYHNFDEKGRRAMNKAVFAALKSGGVYGIVDHTRRHMQEHDNENRRRIDPVLTIKEVIEAGFEFKDFSDLHYRADDELRYEVGRKTVKGNTDRFTLKFVKP